MRVYFFQRFRNIADDAWHIRAGSAIIDGEIVVPAANGTTDFSILQNELKGKSTKIVLVAFDLLCLNGYDLRKLLLRAQGASEEDYRRDRRPVQRKLRSQRQKDVRAACKVGLEGVVSKVRDSRYPSGRSRDWVKKTCAQRETLTFAGFALDGNKWDCIYMGPR
ncbi:hypothetical protein [Bradyrhizobium sp. RDI18]|uniref:ATP-dependent DNA ligase n=1 Tax=Bradyrhizobium sp. RDI18 TaxID=3367400 RepID=UPI00371C78CD